MLLFEATSALVTDVPFMVYEVLQGDVDDPSLLSSNQVTGKGLTPAERIPLLLKVYVIEPSPKQVVLTSNLHNVSARYRSAERGP